jgi:hypothetical protein
VLNRSPAASGADGEVGAAWAWVAAGAAGRPGAGAAGRAADAVGLPAGAAGPDAQPATAATAAATPTHRSTRCRMPGDYGRGRTKRAKNILGATADGAG